MDHKTPARTRPRRVPTLFTGLLVLSAAIAAIAYRSLPSPSTPAASPLESTRGQHHGVLGEAVASTVWPAYGQAAFIETGQSQIEAGPNQHAAPIASVAKVMTAYLVLRDHPLRLGETGPTITLTDADVADTDRRTAQDESIVPIAAGERLTELQALQALLLPSANNIAAVLARWDAGSASRFVARMNATARSLDMTATRYTDPSGYDDTTVSTAADQVRIVVRAMRQPVFARVVATQSAWLPVAGTVHNTNRLLGQNGFVGVKTGSDRAAGSCFAFRATRSIRGKRTTITGVVLGQPGYDPIGAGLMAADAMVDRISGQRTTPRLQQPALPAPAPPGRRRRWRRVNLNPREEHVEKNTVAAGRSRSARRDRRGLRQRLRRRRQPRKRHVHCPRQGGAVRRVHAHQRRQRLPGPERVRPAHHRRGRKRFVDRHEQRDVQAGDERVQGLAAARIHGRQGDAIAEDCASRVRAMRPQPRCIRLP